jgi:hypothetical protein
MLTLADAVRELERARFMAKHLRHDRGWRVYYVTWALTYRRTVRRLKLKEAQQ